MTGFNSANKPLKKEKPSGEENCRCKETAKKTPIEMLKLMLNDLAFWKKKK